LLLLGGESPQRRHVTAEMLHRSLSGSRITVLQGQQHSAMRTAPDLFVREVLAFLHLHGGVPEAGAGAGAWPVVIANAHVLTFVCAAGELKRAPAP
jgi:hypothetical protein